jgi:methyl-accepting chemotaxis protein
MKGIGGKFLLIFGVILALNVGTNVFVSIYMNGQKDDGRVINLAGKQRMLTQKMSKEALLLTQDTGVEESKTLLEGTASLFDRTLKGLVNGDNELGLPPATDDKFLAQLGTVKSIWINVKDSMDVILREEPESPSFQQAMTVIASQNIPLLKEMNKAVVIYENAAVGKANFLWWANNAIIALNVMVVALAWILVVRPLVKMLFSVIRNLRTGSATTVSTSEHISASSQSLSQGTAEQASSIEETTATLEEMASMVNQNADNAREAVQLVNLCNVSAEKGNHAVTETNHAMQEINESSKKIAEILKVIDGIAFQTNLLALNAAVEAARAGDHGKGFAVVAEEVRNLAQRSAAAARDTDTLIKDSVQKADSGAKLAQGCGDALQEIVTNVKKVTNLINEISVASQEQAQGTTQLGQTMQQMDTITQQNATNAEETASASEELFSQAKVLTKLVEKVSLAIGINGYDKHDDRASKPLKTHRQTGLPMRDIQTGRLKVQHGTKPEQDVDDFLFKTDEEKALIEN